MLRVAADPADELQGYAHPERLVTTEWLAEHLDDPSVVVAESNVRRIAIISKRGASTSRRRPSVVFEARPSHHPVWQCRARQWLNAGHKAATAGPAPQRLTTASA